MKLHNIIDAAIKKFPSFFLPVAAVVQPAPRAHEPDADGLVAECMRRDLERRDQGEREKVPGPKQAEPHDFED